MGLAGLAAGLTWAAAPDEAEEYYRRGRADLREHWDPVHMGAATRDFERAVALDSTWAEAWAALGEARLRWAMVNPGIPRGDSATYNMARGFGLRALELAPGLADGHFTLGLGELYRWNSVGAEYELKQALHSDPTHAAAWRGLGEAYAMHGDLEASEHAYRQAIKADPTHWAGYAGLADHGPGRGAEAIRLLERAAELRPRTGTS